MSEQAYLLEFRWITEQTCIVSFLALNISDNFTEFLFLLNSRRKYTHIWKRSPVPLPIFFHIINSTAPMRLNQCFGSLKFIAKVRAHVLEPMGPWSGRKVLPTVAESNQLLEKQASVQSLSCLLSHSLFGMSFNDLKCKTKNDK